MESVALISRLLSLYQRPRFSNFLAVVDENYIFEAHRLVAEEFHAILPQDVTMKYLMYMFGAARNQRKERNERIQKQNAAT